MGVLAVFLLSESLLSPGWWALSLHPGSAKTQALCFSRSCILPLMERGEFVGEGSHAIALRFLGSTSADGGMGWEPGLWEPQ